MAEIVTLGDALDVAERAAAWRRLEAEASERTGEEYQALAEHAGRIADRYERDLDARHTAPEPQTQEYYVPTDPAELTICEGCE